MRLTLALFLATLSHAAAADAMAAATTRTKPVDPTSRLIGLVEYVGGDYGGAVLRGKVISEAEYKEMVEFSDAAARELETQKTRFKPEAQKDLEASIAALKALVAAKADASAVSTQARTIRDRIIEALGVATAPATTPAIAAAEKAFDDTCATCHGKSGHGDGPDGKGLEPLPRNFHEADVVAAISPYKVYNTLHTGVEGTEMEAYDEVMDDAALWALAYYVPAWPDREAFPDLAKLAPDAAIATLPEGVRKDLAAGGLSLSLLARLSDPELRVWVKRTVKSPALDAATLGRYVAVLKMAAPFATTTPVAALVPQPEDETPKTAALAPLSQDALTAALARAKAKVSNAKSKFAANDTAGAEADLYDAYLGGYERLEKPLRIRHGDHVTATEAAFVALREKARTADAPGFAAASAELDRRLAEAGDLLAAQAAPPHSEELADAGSFFSSFIIIVREGFEAFLIIGAILTLLTKQGQPERKKYVHFGWISAAIAGLLSYVVFTHAVTLTGATRETIEAVCTGLAAVVLFYVSFWLLNQAERGRWEGFLKSQAKSLTANQSKTGALYLLAFIAVYREAAETVLFYAALGASSPSTTTVVAGFVTGVVVLSVVCAAIMRFGVRLPMRKFFLSTSTLMILISIVLVGKSVKELVEAGYVKPTLLPWMPTVDALGIYHYGESVAAQAFAVVFAGGLVWLSTRQSRPRGALKGDLKAAPTSGH